MYLSSKLSIMLNTKVIKGLTDLRADPQGISQLAKTEGPVYIFNRNKPISVVVDIDEYKAQEELIDKLQDALDVAEIKEMKKTAKPEDFVSHEKLFQDLGIK